MKKMIFAACAAAMMCSCSGGDTATNNPFFETWSTPWGVPPFEQIKPEHYKPAFLKAMELQKAEVESIVNNTEEPTFENTIVALDQSGSLLTKVSMVFYGQTNANTNDELQAIQAEISPLLTKHGDDISLNAELFERVKAVYAQKEQAGLDKEQMKLLEETYKDFVRGGANLDSASQAQLRELNTQISSLQTTFGQNMLKATNAFKLIVDNEADLAGLPENLIATAAETAKADSMEGKWVFTLHNPSVMPFLQYADNRALREKIFNGYISRGQDGEFDNREVCAQLVKARLAKAKLMGYEDYASFVLETRMAKNSEAVYNLLDQVWTPALKQAKKELKDIKAEIKKAGENFEPQGWDWRYYADRAKKTKYDFDETLIRPYLELNNVRDGMFLFANKLYGVNFTLIDSIPLPHPDAQAFECTDKDGSHLGVLYLDYFPRASKRGGAWCGQYRAQTYKDGVKVAPVVTIVCNFTKPTAGQPALLTADEAETLYHEFGHALHNLFRDVHYYGVASVPRDFVELPSQVNEHWVFEPEMLKEYAKHYQTGEIIPNALVERLIQSGKYGQGFVTTEYVAASLLDMDFHTMKEIPADFDVMAFEAQTLGQRGLLSQIPSRYRTTYFNHTMGGGYTAGYYSYLWSEVLDADAFEAFKETGNIFNTEVAEKFRNYVLKPGAIDDAMDMYVNFRGKEPNIEPLLKNRGLK
ncbi:MAG: M3 family metallopeptidase [Bacteroidaceae bacterium]|nr:M3 family metallopeptidase [Bacteroidaceae bacterium]